MEESINTAGFIWLGSRSQTLLKSLFTLFSMMNVTSMLFTSSTGLQMNAIKILKQKKLNALALIQCTCKVSRFMHSIYSTYAMIYNKNAV